MGSGLKKGGWILLITGIVLTLLFIPLGIYYIVAGDTGEQVMSEDDFYQIAPGEYRASGDPDVLGSEIEVIIRYKAGHQRDRFRLTVEDPDGYDVYEDYRFREAPLTETIHLGSDYYWGDWVFTIDFEASDSDITDLDIEIRTTDLTGSQAMICCGLVSVAALGVVISIPGLIMVVIGHQREKDARDKKIWESEPQKDVKFKVAGQESSGPSRPAASAQSGGGIRIPVQDTGQKRGTGQVYICPYCSNASVPVQKTKMSNIGIILLVILVIFIWPLFWIGFLIRERYTVCSVCGRTLTPFDIEKGKEGAGVAMGARETKMDVRERLINMARQHEREGRYDHAIRIYEQLELFDDAERCLRKSKGMEPKLEDPVNVIKSIRGRGIWANYQCPYCHNTMVIDGSKLTLRFCSTCSRPIDFDLLSRY